MHTAWKGYAMALLLMGFGLLLRWPLWPLIGNEVPYITFFPAIAMSSWYGGLRAGLLATLLCSLAADLLLIEPYNPFDLTSRTRAITLVIFFLMGTIISWLMDERNLRSPTCTPLTQRHGSPSCRGSRRRCNRK